jgi:UDPglucose 6-dehydrogenase
MPTFDNVMVVDLIRGVITDSRINPWGSYIGNGAGGSCFSKDILSLIDQLRQKRQSYSLLQSVYDVNSYQKTYLVDRAVNEAGFNFNNKTIALWGLAFRRGTNDIRDSSSLKTVEALLGRGVKAIQAYDPLAIEEAKHYFAPYKNNLFERISYHDNVKDTLRNSDGLFISTDWEEFRGLARIIENLVKPPYLIIDGRCMVANPENLVKKGYTYLAVGSKLLTP